MSGSVDETASTADPTSALEGTPSPVGVLGGSGKQGQGLALRLALAGHPVRIGSRSPERGVEAAGSVAQRAGRDDLDVTGGDQPFACQAPVVIASIPFAGLEETLAPLAEALDGRVVVSCVVGLAMDGAGPHPVLAQEGSAAERIQGLLPASQVVGAFQNLAAGKLLAAPEPIDADVLITGDAPEARAHAAALVRAVPGLRPVEAGPLRLSRPVEEMTPVLIALNRAHRTTTSLAITGLEG